MKKGTKGAADEAAIPEAGPLASQPEGVLADPDAEAARIAAEQQAADEARIAAEQQAADEARIAAEQQAADEARIAAEQQAADEARIAAEQQAADEARIAAEQQAADDARIAAEKPAIALPFNAFEITSVGPVFRRCGRVFTHVPTVIPVDGLAYDTLQRLLSEPRLRVREVTIDVNEIESGE